MIDVATSSFFAIVVAAVGAAMLSALVFPFVGLTLRRHGEANREPHIEERGPDAGSPPLGGEPVVRPRPAA
ncbi:MAG: hypothetical protein JST08_05245 [Actinobacteria bacterium]|nr:hypothetical protein [Actinomycetota bacterium]